VHGRRNLIINGAMNHWQRGMTKTYTANDTDNYHTADRWGKFLDFDEGSGSLSVTISQSTDVPSGEGFAYSLKGATTPSSFAKSGSDNLALFTYKVETYDAAALQWGTSGARKATLSYWIKSDTAGTGTLQIRLTDSSVVSGASDGNFYTKFTVNAADTWEYKTHEIPANSTDGWRYTVSNIAMHIHWYFGSNQSAAATQDAWFRNNNHGQPHSDNTYDFMNNAGEAFITGVQLEVGEEATPFEHRSFGEELAACRRYYCQSGAHGVADNPWTAGVTTNANYNYMQTDQMNSSTDRNPVSWMWPTPMRTSPTMTYYPARTAVANTASRINPYNSNTLVTFGTTPAARPERLAGYFAGTSTDSNVMTFNYTADAEL